MKKRMALFLAATMALAPVGVFAGSNNTLVRQPSNVTKNTVMFENDSLPVSQMINLFPSGYTDASDSEKIENTVNGADLQITMGTGAGDKLNANDVFKVDLTNAEWFFRNTRDLSYTGSHFADLFKANAKFKNPSSPNGNYNNVTSINGKPVTAGNNFAASDFEPISGSALTAEELTYIYNNFVQPIGHNVVIGGSGILVSTGLTSFTVLSAPSTYPKYDKDFTGEGFKRQAGTSTEYTSSDFFDKLAATFKSGAGKISTYNPNNGIFISSLNTYYRFGASGIIYSLKIEGSDYNKGIVRMHKAWGNSDGTLIIPIVARVTGDGEVRVSVAKDGNYTAISAGDLQISTVSSKKTETSVTNKVTAKYNFPLKDLVIKEINTSSIQQGYIEIKAPDGFYFSDPRQASYTNEDDNREYLKFVAEGTLGFKNGQSELSSSSGTYYATYGLDDNGNVDKSKVRINTGASDKGKSDGFSETTAGLGIVQTTQTRGNLVIKNLVLMADDHASSGEIKLNIKGDGITEEDFVIGTRSEWGLEFKTLTDPTKLVNGRLNSAYSKSITSTATSGYISSNTSFDKEHKTARVKFSENVVASWWSLRESEFTLPSGVKFLQVKISKEENLDHVNNAFKLNGEYPLSDTKSNYVTLNSDKLRVADLQIKRDKTAAFEMDIWVSVESGFEGDILLSIGGSDSAKEVTPLKIASAVSPVTVKSEAKSVKVGYQWQKVADVIITETEIGMLQKDKEVVLTIDDGITGSDKIAFAPDFVTEVNTDSNIVFSKPTVDGGNIKFTIERASNSKPASIKFSNMYVKIDRTVPETNKRPYAIVVGGEAIAANYYGNRGITTAKSYHPLFSVKGIGTDYINVVTSAPNSSSLFSNVVKVTIDSNEVVVGKDGSYENIQMDTAAYISTSNSTMVPVRFVVQAFGLPDSQIIWDEDARTVTILGGPNGTVQFTLGSDQISIGGATFTMYSPENPPRKVSAEVKDNRSFLPFRQLGNALGISVEWDESTKTAIYNADAQNAISDIED